MLQELLDTPEDGNDESDRQCPNLRWTWDGGFGSLCLVFASLALCILVLFAVVFAEAISWRRIGTCEGTATDEGQRWNFIIPPNTVLQKQLAWTSLFWTQVDVFDSDFSKSPVGFWTDADLFFGLLSRYAYTTTFNGSASLQLEASRPFGIFFGKRYELFRCGGGNVSYIIEEDYWNEPWFQFFSWKTIFKVTQRNTGQLVAISTHTRDNMLDIFGAKWTAEIVSPNGTHIASIFQDSFADTDWFQYPPWHTKGLRQDLLPNEVVSFLAAVYDIDSGKRSGSHGNFNRNRGR